MHYKIWKICLFAALAVLACFDTVSGLKLNQNSQNQNSQNQNSQNQNSQNQNSQNQNSQNQNSQNQFTDSLSSYPSHPSYPSSETNTTIDKLSGSESMALLKIVHELQLAKIHITDSESWKQLESYLKLAEFNIELDLSTDLTLVEDRIHNIINLTLNNKSMFTKLRNLVSFQYVVLFFLVGTTLAFVVSLFWNVIQLLLLNDVMICIEGYALSYLTLILKTENIINTPLYSIWILDDYTCLFGAGIFALTTFYAQHAFASYYDKHSTSANVWNYREKNNFEKTIKLFSQFVILLCWSIATVYHNNNVLGIFSVIMLFSIFGFEVGSMFGGYYTGFGYDVQIENVFAISVLLNLFYVVRESGMGFTHPFYENFAVFETGITFWGTLVGSIAALIIASDYNCRINGTNYKNYMNRYIVMKFMLCMYCLALVYAGNMQNNSAFKSIGGTFLGLTALDLEREFLMQFSTGSLTVVLGVISANLYGIYRVIGAYPEYFII
jgi:hypothetical protein